MTRLVWAFDFSVDEADKVFFDKFPVIMLIQKEDMNLRVKLRDETDQ